MVKVEPDSSSRLALPVRAASARRAISRGEVPQVAVLRVADDRDHQPVRSLRRHAHMDGAVAGDDLRVVVIGGVDLRIIGQRAGEAP